MDNSILVVLGRKGSGKSTLVREIIREKMVERRRVLIIDGMGEYGGEGIEVVHGVDDALDRIEKIDDHDRFAYAFRTMRSEDDLDLIGVAYEVPNQLLVIEEASRYCSATQLPDEIGQLVRYGRHREIDMIFIARRPSELHRDVTANADVVVTFQQHEPRDVLYLRSIFGERAERAKLLPRFKVMVFGDPKKVPLSVFEAVEPDPQGSLDLPEGDDLPS